MASSQPASYLFDRAHGVHPWFAALGALQTSSIAGHAPLAQNWRMDARVDAVRESHLDGSGCFPAGSAGSGFDAAIRDYYAHYLCRSSSVAPLSAYVEGPNQDNLIPFDQRPARSHHLLHMASVKSLLKFALGAYSSGKADFEMAVFRLSRIRLSAHPDSAEIERLIASLQARGSDAIGEFARELSTVLGSTEPHWWAAFAHEVGDLGAIDDWTDAVRKTGQGHIEPDEWLLAWRYSPEVVGKLYRPTVAEAGVYAYHFPSPPLVNYGITMPLAQGLPAVRELIHAPLKGDICAESCIGFGQVRGDPAPLRGVGGLSSWFQTRRHEHSEHLVRHQPPLTQSWLTRHSVMP
ncbi:MAG: hypothetical protein A2Z95_02380 [Gallionellales bacterium GWA2_60_18]|nr:MAG: hypothetical protein A2Z95_02380 [Gallionellales bacterium GWA2_60_18]